MSNKSITRKQLQEAASLIKQCIPKHKEELIADFDFYVKHASCSLEVSECQEHIMYLENELRALEKEADQPKGKN